jgi:hypothetical protein
MPSKIEARGDVISVPVEKGTRRNLTHTSDTEGKWAVENEGVAPDIVACGRLEQKKRRFSDRHTRPGESTTR